MGRPAPGTRASCSVDSHELIALCAPRLVFISYGVPARGDANWLDHRGSWMAAVAAGKVFRLLGAKDLGVGDDYATVPMPPVLTGLLDGQLAWRQHDGGHTDAPERGDVHPVGRPDDRARAARQLRWKICPRPARSR